MGESLFVITKDEFWFLKTFIVAFTFIKNKEKEGILKN